MHFSLELFDKLLRLCCTFQCSHLNLLLIILVSLNIQWISGQGFGRAKEFRDVAGGEILAPRSSEIDPHEPSCEELRAMWR